MKNNVYQDNKDETMWSSETFVVSNKASAGSKNICKGHASQCCSIVNRIELVNAVRMRMEKYEDNVMMALNWEQHTVDNVDGSYPCIYCEQKSKRFTYQQYLLMGFSSDLILAVFCLLPVSLLYHTKWTINARP